MGLLRGGTGNGSDSKAARTSRLVEGVGGLVVGSPSLGARGAAASPQRSVTMKPLMAFALAVMMAAAAFGTAQVPDKLILDGKEVPLFENPLEYLWLDETGTPVLFAEVFAEPPTSPEGQKKQEALSSRRPEVLRDGGGASNNWRGYVATWQIDGDRLLLVKIEQSFQTAPVPEDRKDWDRWTPKWELREVPIDQVLPGKTLPLLAEWYSGRLRIPQGEMLDYVHMGYGSRSERDTFLEFKNGALVSRVDIDNIGKNFYRTEYAQPWKTYGEEGGTDWSWIDPRMFNYTWIGTLQDSGAAFRTRGGFSHQPSSNGTLWLSKEGAKAALLIFETPDRSRDAIPLHALPDGALPADGTLVEIECRFVKNGERQELHVSSIRELKPSEALFHTDFPEFIAKWRNEMNAARERKAAEAKNAPEPARTE